MLCILLTPKKYYRTIIKIKMTSNTYLIVIAVFIAFCIYVYWFRNNSDKYCYNPIPNTKKFYVTPATFHCLLFYFVVVNILLLKT